MAIFLNTMTAFSYGGTGAVSFIPILYTILIAYLIMGWAFFVPGKDTKTARLAAFLAFFLGITLAWNIYYWFLMFVGWGEDEKLMNWKCPADFRAAEMTGPVSPEMMEKCLEENKMTEFYNGLVFFAIDCYFAFEIFRWYKDA